MRVTAPSALLFAAGFAVAQDVFSSTETVVVPEDTETVYVPLPEETSASYISTTTVYVLPDTVTVSEGVETATEWVQPVPVPESTETEVVTAVPTETTSWIRYWPDISSSTIITTTYYHSLPPNATDAEDAHPTAAGVGRVHVGSSLAALVGFGAAGLLML